LALGGCAAPADVDAESAALGVPPILSWPHFPLPDPTPTPPPPATPPDGYFPLSAPVDDVALGNDIAAAKRLSLGNGPVVAQLVQSGMWLNEGTSEWVRLTAAQNNLLRHFHKIGARADITLSYGHHGPHADDGGLAWPNPVAERLNHAMD